MTIIINGSCHEFAEGSTLPSIIASLGLPPETLLIEHNGTALHQSEWPSRTLCEGDKLEFLRIAAGG